MKQTGISDEKIEELLRTIQQTNDCEPSRGGIDRTIYRACEILDTVTQVKRIGFIEFVANQIRFMKKKWWILQSILLFFACEWISISGDTDYTYRGLSILASLFVILIIPEFWKNIECGSFEIEEASVFDLRSVYAAKFIAFGVVDTVLLTFFCVLATQLQGFLFADVLKQFVFPVMIAAAICLLSFSSKKRYSEVTTMMLCVISNLAWMILAMNESVYSEITPLVWIGLFGFCSFIIIYCVSKSLRRSGEYWEVWIHGLGVG
uniref:ABC-2 family transporter protein n=1 Tax=Eubacterium cellulosolvens (strain ATCC 43171 / JCM 9499 / 6) TaxID=633697 RepID=I5AR94_EUBC6